MDAMNQYACKRLYDHLEIKGQHRQIVFIGGDDDDFMVNLKVGTLPIDEAIKTILLQEKIGEKECNDYVLRYDYVLLINRQNGRMEYGSCEKNNNDKPDFNDLISPRQSRDPNRGNRTSSVSDDSSISTNHTGSSGERNPLEAVESITQSSSDPEINELGRLTKCVQDNKDSNFAIVYMYPDTMLLDCRDVQLDLYPRLRFIGQWATLENCTSFLILSEHRQQDFVQYLNYVQTSKEYSQNIAIAPPEKLELATFLKRVVCRHRLMCNNVDTIATTAAAEGTSLRNFSVQLRNFVNAGNTFLDKFFSDESKVRSLEEVLTQFKALVGLDAVKNYVDELYNLYNSKERNRLAPLPHFMFLGNPGTGKTTVARLLGQLFLNLGLRTRNAFVEMSYADLVSDSSQSPVEVMMGKIKKAMGGVLFIDEVYLLAEEHGGRMALQALMKEMEGKRDSFTVIMAGYAERLSELYKVNPGFKSRIGKEIEFVDYTTDELTSIVCGMLMREYGKEPTPNVKARIESYIDSRQQRGGMGNGRGARTLFEHICRSVQLSGDRHREVCEADIPVPMSLHIQEAEELIQSFERDLSGLRRVKDFMRDMFNRQLAQENWRRAYEAAVAPGHKPKAAQKPEMNNCFFLGNPGTGKNTVARKMGKLFYYLGLVSEQDKLKEVDPIQAFTSSYVGEYAQKVRDVFDEVLGGVLFIDEAYQLANDEQGRKILDQIVKLATEPRYMDMVIIMAGYPDEMLKLYQCNSGLKRRFPHQVYFDDFSNTELVDIFMQQVQKKEMRIQEGEEPSFKAHLRAILARMATERHFGNAGTVINFFGKVFGNQAKRLAQHTDADPLVLLPEDLMESSVVARDFDTIMHELEEWFVGLSSFKDRMRALANCIRVGKLREKRLGLPLDTGTNHLCFVGNMGTGKKSMAKYMAEIFYSFKIVAHPQLRVWRGIDLKGSYVGQTKDKVNKMFEDCTGSVVFIDEIYGLLPAGSSSQDSFGLEAVDALAGGLSDPRNATTVVILSGRRQKLERFLASNPQLGAFFGQSVEFPDYTASECLAILKLKLKKKNYEIPKEQCEAFDQNILAQLTHIRKEAGENFGNVYAVNGIITAIMDARNTRFGAMMDRGENISDEMLCNIDVNQDLPKMEN